MATRTSLYSFRRNIIEIGITVDPIGAVHSPDTPITEEELKKYDLLPGKNPWKHLGVPDFAIESECTSSAQHETQAGASSGSSSSAMGVERGEQKISSIDIEELADWECETHKSGDDNKLKKPVDHVVVREEEPDSKRQRNSSYEDSCRTAPEMGRIMSFLYSLKSEDLGDGKSSAEH